MSQLIWSDAPDETAWNFVVRIHKWIPFFSAERPGQHASTSEIRRWLEQGAILINEGHPKPNDLLNTPVHQFILFPKSQKRKCTLV